MLEANSVNAISEDIINLVLKEVESEKQLSEQSRNRLAVNIRQKLTTMKNISYTQGFSAGSSAK